MKQTLSDFDRDRLNKMTADVEKRTNTQIVLAVIRRSDSYAELPWKAFALGASIASLLLLILDRLFLSWYSGINVLIAVAGTMAGGVVFALLSVLISGFAKRFLSAFRAEVEVKQYADSLFLSRELFATSNRKGILMLVSLFERKIVLLPDKGLESQLSNDTMQNIITAMTPYLKQNKIGLAFEAGLELLSRTLGIDVQGSGGNELSDEIIEEKGV